MASILFKIARICNSQFNHKYLEKEKNFLNFLFNFWNLYQILNIFKEKMIVIANVSEFTDCEKSIENTL